MDTSVDSHEGLRTPPHPLERNITGLRRGLAVLAGLAARPQGISFKEIRGLLGGVPPTTASRVLKILLDEGWVEKRDERYAAGNAFRRAARALAGGLTTGEMLAPVVEALAEETSESAAYFELREDQVVLLAKCDQPDSFHHIEVNRTHRFFTAHAFSHVCIAHLEPAEQERYYDLCHEPHSMPRREFFRRLKRIPGQEAYVYLRGGLPGSLHCVVAPVFLEAQRRRVGAIGITMLREPDAAELAKRLAQVARAGRTASETLARTIGMAAARTPSSPDQES